MKMYLSRFDEAQSGHEHLIARTLMIGDSRISIRLEPIFWSVLERISLRENWSVDDICAEIESRRQRDASLVSSIRVFVLCCLTDSS